MELKTAVQLAVINTNFFPPLKKTYERFYKNAIKMFLDNVSCFEPVRHIYLINSLSEKNWVPGLSDIDFCIFIKKDMESDEEFEFLDKFWKLHSRIKSKYPVLGDVGIFSQREYASFEYLMKEDYRYKYWNPLYGGDFLRNYVSPKTMNNGRFFYAFTCFFDFLVKRFFLRNRSRFILKRDISRICGKIKKHVSDFTTKDTRTEDPALESMHILSNVKEKRDSVQLNEVAFGTVKNGDSAVYRFDKSYLFKEFTDELTKKYGACLNSIILIGMKYYRLLVIIKDNLADGTRKKIVSRMFELSRKLNMGDYYPYFLTERMFNNACKYYHPFWHYWSLQKSRILYGKERLPADLPDKNLTAAYIIRRALFSPSRLRCAPWVNMPYKQWIFEESMATFIKETIITLLFLGRNIFVYSEQSLFDAWRKEYPDLYDIYTKASNKPEERFSLLKKVSFMACKKAQETIEGSKNNHEKIENSFYMRLS